MINPPKKLLLALILSFGLLVSSVTNAQGGLNEATFSLSPSDGAAVSGTFEVTIGLVGVADGDAVSGVDISLNYEPGKLEEPTIDISGGVFANYPLQAIDATNGKIVIGAAAPAHDPVTADGKIATITFAFRDLTTSQSTTLDFDYAAGSTVDSNIIVESGEDILTQTPEVTYNFEPSGPFALHLVPVWNRITWLAELPGTFTSYSALDHIESGCPRPEDPPRAFARRKNGWWESAVHGYGGADFTIVADHAYYVKVASVCDWQPGS